MKSFALAYWVRFAVEESSNSVGLAVGLDPIFHRVQFVLFNLKDWHRRSIPLRFRGLHNGVAVRSCRSRCVRHGQCNRSAAW